MSSTIADLRPLASTLSPSHFYLRGALSSLFLAAVHRRNLRKPSRRHLPKVYGKVCSSVCAHDAFPRCVLFYPSADPSWPDSQPALCHTSSLMLDVISLGCVALDPYILLQLVLKLKWPGEGGLPFYKDHKGSLCGLSMVAVFLSDSHLRLLRAVSQDRASLGKDKLCTQGASSAHLMNSSRWVSTL